MTGVRSSASRICPSYLAWPLLGLQMPQEAEVSSFKIICLSQDQYVHETTKTLSHDQSSFSYFFGLRDRFGTIPCTASNSSYLSGIPVVLKHLAFDPVESMPGIYQYLLDRLSEEINRIKEAGIKAI